MRLLSTGRAVRAARDAHLTCGISRTKHRAFSISKASLQRNAADQQAVAEPTTPSERRRPRHLADGPRSFRRLQLNNAPLYTDTSSSPPTRRTIEDRATLSQKRASSAAQPSTNPSYTPSQLHLVDEAKSDQVPSIGDKTGIFISGRLHTTDSTSNVSPSILDLLDRRLYLEPNHPLSITRKLIESAFAGPTFHNSVSLDPVVTTADNFDALGFPADHPGRSRTDTYYVNEKHVLRTHTSAHQVAAFAQLAKAAVHTPRDERSGYTICADVYRRDSIDRSHFPVFHQMEGARLWRHRRSPNRHQSAFELYMQRKEEIKRDIKSLPDHDLKVEDSNPAFHDQRNPRQDEHDSQEVRLVATHLKKSLENLIETIMTAARYANKDSEEGEAQEPLQVRWVEAYFPFTSPSWELEVYWQGEWLELLGCGIVKQQILKTARCGSQIGWAWGLGVERLAMLLFGIPDIRLFWSKDERFLGQFKEGRVTKYEPFSKYPECYKDVAFWINAAPATASPIAETEFTKGVAAAAGGDATKASPAEMHPTAFHENDVMEIVRDVAGNLAEDVKLSDEFVHPTNGRKSLCYRINYRSLERTLTNEEVNNMHAEVVSRLASELGVEIR